MKCKESCPYQAHVEQCYLKAKGYSCPYEKEMNSNFTYLKDLEEAQRKVKRYVSVILRLEDMDAIGRIGIGEWLNNELFIRSSKWKFVEDHFECESCDYWDMNKSYFCPRCGKLMSNYYEKEEE